MSAGSTTSSGRAVRAESEGVCVETLTYAIVRPLRRAQLGEDWQTSGED